MPHPTDVHVGQRVREARLAKGMTQTDLGNALGISFQQVQKYERGANRIGSSRLFDLSRVLDVPVSFFFDDMPTELEGRSPRKSTGLAEAPIESFETDPLTKRETLDLVSAYYRIGNPSVRRRLFDLAKSLGAAT